MEDASVSFCIACVSHLQETVLEVLAIKASTETSFTGPHEVSLVQTSNKCAPSCHL